MKSLKKMVTNYYGEDFRHNYRYKKCKVKQIKRGVFNPVYIKPKPEEITLGHTVNELKKKPISQQGPVDEPEIKTESKSLEEGAKEDLGIEPGSDEEAEDTLTESVNIGDKVKILNSNELHNNKQGEVTYIDDDIITVKLDNGRSFNYDKNQVQKIEEGVKEKLNESYDMYNVIEDSTIEIRNLKEKIDKGEVKDIKEVSRLVVL